MFERELSNLPNLSRHMTHAPSATVFALTPNETCQIGNPSTAANWGSSFQNLRTRFRHAHFMEDIALPFKQPSRLVFGVYKNYRLIK
jgi:hypothetical protein